MTATSKPRYEVLWDDGDIPQIVPAAEGVAGKSFTEAKHEVLGFYTDLRDTAREMIKRFRALKADDIDVPPVDKPAEPSPAPAAKEEPAAAGPVALTRDPEINAACPPHRKDDDRLYAEWVLNVISTLPASRESFYIGADLNMWDAWHAEGCKVTAWLADASPVDKQPDGQEADDSNGCPGHYDDDHTLTSGVGIGEPTYCDGTCRPTAQAGTAPGRDEFGPIETEPSKLWPPYDGYVEARVNDKQAALLDAARGLELGDYDRRTLTWLAGWEIGTVAVVVSLLERARAAGRAEAGGSDG